jgi:hypothetical protein
MNEMKSFSRHENSFLRLKKQGPKNPKDSELQNLEYHVDQVGSKDAGSQNFRIKG